MRHVTHDHGKSNSLEFRWFVSVRSGPNFLLGPVELSGHGSNDHSCRMAALATNFVDPARYNTHALQDRLTCIYGGRVCFMPAPILELQYISPNSFIWEHSPPHDTQGPVVVF